MEDEGGGGGGGSVPQTLDQFLNHFLANHRDDNFLAIKAGNYGVDKEFAANEVIDWTLQYLEWM